MGRRCPMEVIAWIHLLQAQRYPFMKTVELSVLKVLGLSPRRLNSNYVIGILTAPLSLIEHKLGSSSAVTSSSSTKKTLSLSIAVNLFSESLWTFAMWAMEKDAGKENLKSRLMERKLMSLGMITTVIVSIYKLALIAAAAWLLNPANHYHYLTRSNSESLSFL